MKKTVPVQHHGNKRVNLSALFIPELNIIEVERAYIDALSMLSIVNIDV